jgi:hypothetical protein
MNNTSLNLATIIFPDSFNTKQSFEQPTRRLKLHLECMISFIFERIVTFFVQQNLAKKSFNTYF